MAKKKVGQFDHYRRWTTDEGYTFLARDREDAEMYLKIYDIQIPAKAGGHLGKLKEVVSE